MELVHAKGPALRAWQDLVMEWQLTTPQWQASHASHQSCGRSVQTPHAGHSCTREPSPGADVGEVSPVPVQMWQG